MSLSKQTLDSLLESESHIRSAIKSAAMNEKPYVVNQLSKILYDMENVKKCEDLMDMLEGGKSKGSYKF
jgi:hypothetical protein